MSLLIVTINFNNKQDLERTFKSIFSQSVDGFDYIVIGGDSTDSRWSNICKEFFHDANYVMVEAQPSHEMNLKKAKNEFPNIEKFNKILCSYNLKRDKKFSLFLKEYPPVFTKAMQNLAN